MIKYGRISGGFRRLPSLRATMAISSLETARAAVAEQVKFDVLTSPVDYDKQLKTISRSFICTPFLAMEYIS